MSESSVRLKGVTKAFDDFVAVGEMYPATRPDDDQVATSGTMPPPATSAATG